MMFGRRGLQGGATLPYRWTVSDCAASPIILKSEKMTQVDNSKLLKVKGLTKKRRWKCRLFTQKAIGNWSKESLKSQQFADFNSKGFLGISAMADLKKVALILEYFT
jgi:hypothetical protein